MKISGLGFVQKIANVYPKAQTKVSFGNNLDEFCTNPTDAEFKKKFRVELDNKQEEIYKFLDTVKIKDISNLKDGTPVEIISQFFDGQKEYREIPQLMHKTFPQNALKIVEDGFSEKKINTTAYGPAIYFGTNEGSLEIYSGIILNADFKGNCAEANVNIEKSNVLKNALTKEIANYMGIDMMQFSPELMLQLSVIDSFANEYIRQKIVNDLKIDGAFEKSSREGYFLAFNPKAISNVGFKH